MTYDLFWSYAAKGRKPEDISQPVHSFLEGLHHDLQMFVEGVYEKVKYTQEKESLFGTQWSPFFILMTSINLPNQDLLVMVFTTYFSICTTIIKCILTLHKGHLLLNISHFLPHELAIHICKSAFLEL